MAYKDEYEVARLYSDGAFAKELSEAFEGDFKITYHLAPPKIARIDPVTGRPRKMKFGPWTLRLFRVLARLKWLRGTRFDPFGGSEERRQERALIVNMRLYALSSLRACLRQISRRRWRSPICPTASVGMGR